MNLSEVARQRALTTEGKCIAYLEKMRWPEGVRCPACGSGSVSHFQSKGKSGKARQLYQCLDRTCRYQFSPTTGTIFHDSHLPLNTWFRAIALVCDAQQPMSVNQLRLALGVQYKTAAHLTERIRQAMANASIELKPEPALSPPNSWAAQQRPSPVAPQAAARSAVASSSIARHRVETANLLSQVASGAGSKGVSSTAVDNMLSMFVSLAQITVRPPLFFVNYLKDKVFT